MALGADGLSFSLHHYSMHAGKAGGYISTHGLIPITLPTMKFLQTRCQATKKAEPATPQPYVTGGQIPLGYKILGFIRKLFGSGRGFAAPQEKLLKRGWEVGEMAL